MSHCVYPGSFDPITIGHIDIIHRIHKVFDRVTVLVAHSPDKKYLFSTEERKQMILESLGPMNGIDVDIFDGLTVNYMLDKKIDVIVRGLRAVTDFEYEMTMASMNKKLTPTIETLLVFAAPEYYYISSRGVKEVVSHGGNPVGLVPDKVATLLKKRLQK